MKTKINALKNGGLKMTDFLSFIENLEHECYDFKKDLSCLELDQQMEILKLACTNVQPEKEIREKIANAVKNKKTLAIKFGIDPLSTEVQIDHIPPLVLSGKMQRMGHKIVLLIGDFTALIGDPSDITINSKNLNRKNIEKNLKQLRKQLESFLDFTKANIVYNSTWLNDLKLPELIDLMKEIDVSISLGRDDFKEKLESKKGLSYAEIIYPVIMGVDSLELSPDIEIGRHDQFYNFEMCRHMMTVKGLAPESIMTTAKLPHADSLTINEKPINIFKHISKLDKESVLLWYRLLTEITPQSMQKLEQVLSEGILDLHSAKEILAKVIVCRLYDKATSDSSYVEYIKELVKNTATQDIRMTSGSVMGIGEFIAASTDLTLTEAQKIINSGGARALSCDGERLAYIMDSEADISSIDFDKFYIIMSDKLVLRINK